MRELRERVLGAQIRKRGAGVALNTGEKGF